MPSCRCCYLDVLTVGDGDLSCSLALMRAYSPGNSNNGNIVFADKHDIGNSNDDERTLVKINRLVATTLLSSYDDLIRKYPQSKNIVEELSAFDEATILYGVDATQLHDHPFLSQQTFQFDWIIFHHPHLGYSRENDEKQHAQNHECLIAHYLYSAHQLLIKPEPPQHDKGHEKGTSCSCSRSPGAVHLCLCGNQVHSWKVEETMERLGLQYGPQSPRPTSRPFFFPLDGKQQRRPCPSCRRHQAEQQQQTETAATAGAGIYTSASNKHNNKAPRKFRNGNKKLGSRHWLGNYGYQHQPTHPATAGGTATSTTTATTKRTTTTNVSNSYHYYFQQKSRSKSTATATSNTASDSASAAAAAAAAATTSPFRCEICTRVFTDSEALKVHMRSPALPVTTTVAEEEEEKEEAKDDDDDDDDDGDDEKSTTATNDGGQLNEEVMRKQQQHLGKTVNDDDTASLPSLSTAVQQRDVRCTENNKKGTFTKNTTITIIVSEEYNEKRLRWFLQHVMQVGSKRYCERSIVNNRKVNINGMLAIDSGRILRAGDKIEVFERMALHQKQSEGEDTAAASEAGSCGSSTKKKIRIVGSWTSTCHVVYKPVGMPVKDGSHPNPFDPNNHSLEGYFSKQKNSPYVCRTKLDRGCGGLVVVANRTPSENDSLPLAHNRVNRVFVALVHNNVPIEYDGGGDNEKTVDGRGVSINLPIEGLRRWKKKPKATNEATTIGGDGAAATAAAEIFVLERTTSNTTAANNVKTAATTEQHNVATTVPALSTLMIRTKSPVSSLANVICYYLRKSGYPVVGDRFASSEYLALPRSVRNRIKQNLCIGCTRIEFEAASSNDDDARNHNHQDRCLYTAEDPVSEKWSALYWQEHCRNK